MKKNDREVIIKELLNSDEVSSYTKERIISIRKARDEYEDWAITDFLRSIVDGFILFFINKFADKSLLKDIGLALTTARLSYNLLLSLISGLAVMGFNKDLNEETENPVKIK